MKVGRLAVAALALATACGGGERGKISGPYAKEVAQAIPIIEKETGLKFKRMPVLQTRTKAQVRQFLEQRFHQEVSDREITGQEIAYRRLGLIPDTLDLRKFMIRLLTEQVMGFYDPKTKVLYVVDGARKDEMGFLIEHELVHALQDQYTNLDSIQSIHDQNDRTMAAQAVIEGQATLVPLQATLGPGTNLPGGWDRVREMIRQNQSQMPVFASAPFVLQETLIFPYLSGAEFMRQFVVHMPGQQPYGHNMPISTEQILHPNTYFGSRRQEPIAVAFPAPSQGTVLYDDDFGEFETRLFLFQWLQNQPQAVRGAAGWAGDRYEVLQLPKGYGFAWLSVWDSQVQAAEFESDVEQVIAKRFNAPAARTTADGKAYDVKGRTITVWGGALNGHSAVFYTDLPAGVSPAIVRRARVTLTRESQ